MSAARIPTRDSALVDLRRFRSVSGPQLCALVGITYRQLDYWDRVGILSPSAKEGRGHGNYRRYLESDVIGARVLKALIDAGVAVSEAARVLPFVRDPEGCRWAYLGRSAGVCADGELEAVVSEDGSAIVVDLERFTEVAS